MRQIDADGLIKSMGIDGATKWGNKSKEQQHMSYGTFMAYEILDAIEDAPTIDVVMLCAECGAKMGGNERGEDVRAATVEEAIEMLSKPCYENKN